LRQWNSKDPEPSELAGLLAQLRRRSVNDDFQITRGNLAMLALGLKHQDARTAPDTRLDGQWVKRKQVEVPHKPRRTEESFLSTYGHAFDPHRPVVFIAWPKKKMKKTESRDPLKNTRVAAVVCFQVAPAQRVKEDDMDPLMHHSSQCVLITPDGRKEEPGTFSIPLIAALRVNLSLDTALDHLYEVDWSLITWRPPTPIGKHRARVCIATGTAWNCQSPVDGVSSPGSGERKGRASIGTATCATASSTGAARGARASIAFARSARTCRSRTGHHLREQAAAPSPQVRTVARRRPSPAPVSERSCPEIVWVGARAGFTERQIGSLKLARVQ